jgi:hypothetical protein
MELDKLNEELDKRLGSVQKDIIRNINNVMNNTGMFVAQVPDEVNKLLESASFKAKGIFSWYAKGLYKQVGEIQKDFSQYGTTKNIIENVRVKEILNQIGITEEGGLKEKGFLEKISRLTEFKMPIQDLMLRELTSNNTVKMRIENIIKEMESGVSGKIVGNIKTLTHDASWQMSRSIRNEASVIYGYNYFIYAGTEIDTTREFCKPLINNVYHRSDIQYLPKDLPYFQENYKFEKHCGGWGCRHILKWIPDSIGIKLRKNGQI